MRAPPTQYRSYMSESMAAVYAEAVGTTTLPKVPLSYKWIINDAQIFLTRQENLTSPEFTLCLWPHKGSGYKPKSASSKASSWHLLINKPETFTVPRTSYTLRSCEQVKPPELHYSLSLCQGDRDYGGTFDGRKSAEKSCCVLISDLTFSILHPKNDEVLLTQVQRHKSSCEISKEPKTCCTVEFIGCKSIKKYLVDDSLTIRVTATILCINNPIEFLDTICVPQDNIRDSMCHLYKNKLFTDVTIRCEESEFKVHKAILSAQSPVFQTMFEVDMAEKNNGVVDITDTTPTVMSDLVAYFYTGTAPNINKWAKELLNASKKYELPRLFTMCENELKLRITVNNALDTILLADLYDAAALRQACLKFMHFHSTEVRETNQWKQLKVNMDAHGELLIEILEYKP